MVHSRFLGGGKAGGDQPASASPHRVDNEDNMPCELAERLIDDFAAFSGVSAHQNTPLKDLARGAEIKSMLLEIGVGLRWIPFKIQRAER
jgi:hypothetical protein